jgi:hypothetical protein
MQKLTGISSGKNNKSCGIFHHESKKIGFTFSDFYMIFYAIYKNQEITFTIGVHLLQQGPWKEIFLCNVAPGRGWPARVSQIPVRFAGVWPGKGGEEA